jgi:WD40 repeat protein
MAERRPLVTIKGLAGARSAAVHPSGTFAVVALQDHLEILDLDKHSIVNRLWVNRGMDIIDPFANNSDALIPVCLKEFLEHEKIREKLGITSELRAALLKDAKAIEQLSPQAREKLNGMIEDVRRRSRISYESKEQPFDVQFHPNGEQLFVATKGIRVYDWKALLSATQDAPPPSLSVDAPKDDESDPNSRPLAYCVRFDPERSLVLSSCLAGVVQYLNIATGKSGVLLKTEENMSIWRLELTSDKQAICCHCNTHPKVRPRSAATSSVQVWNYPALCHAAGIS